MRPDRRWLTALSIVLVAAASPASAAWYVGVSIGDVEYDLDQDNFEDGSLTSSSIDDETDGAKAYFGWEFNRILGVEGGYVDFNYDADDTPIFQGQSNGTGQRYALGPVSQDFEPEGLYAAATLALYRGRLWNVWAKAGYMYWEADVVTIDSSGTVESDDDGTDTFYGLGAEVVLYKALRLRAEWERFTDVVRDDVDLTSLGLVLRFGR
jgi:hypothetical protein